jgi:hypothetical protein
MSSEPLLSSIIPFAGSGLLGYAMGFYHCYQNWILYCITYYLLHYLYFVQKYPDHYIVTCVLPFFSLGYTLY